MIERWPRATAWALMAVLAGPAPAAEAPTFESAKGHLDAGRLEDAVFGFDAVARALVADPAANRTVIARALVHKGYALVLLGQEEPAKAAFREALGVVPELRLRKGEFPDRVVRVFDAARTGKTRSVMERPAGTAKKAGIGTAGIALIGAGVLVAGAGAAVVVAGGDPPRDPNTTTTSQGFSITFLGSTPAPGGTVSVPGTGDRRTFPMSLQFSVTGPVAATGTLRTALFMGTNASCAEADPQPPFTITPGQAVTVTVSTLRLVGGCPLPVTTNRIVLQLIGVPGEFSTAIENVSYTLAP